MISRAAQSDPSAPAGVGVAPFARVNLLPERTRSRLAERRRAVIWTITNACFAVLGLFAWQWSVVALQDVAEQRIQLAQQHQRVRREERIGGALIARAATLQRQIATLDALRPPERWSQRLASLAAAVPAETLLTAVTITPPEKTPPPAPPPRSASPAARAAPRADDPPRTPPISISGFASEHARLSEFIRALEERAGFADVLLVRSAVTGDASRPLVQFEITATR